MSEREPGRDQARSAFAHILEDLIRRAPGLVAAAFVDVDGETVDYAGKLSPFAVKLAAAHMRIVESQVAQVVEPAHGSIAAVLARAGRQSFAVYSLPDGYALVLVLARYGLTIPPRALARARAALAREAGWFTRPAPWHAIDVELEDGSGLRRRPLRIRVAIGWRTAEIIGLVAGQRERAYRVRLPSGAEFTIVREPRGFWYADEPIADPYGGFAD